MRSFIGACTAFVVLAATTAAEASTVIFHQTGTGSLAALSAALPGPGKYRFEATSNLATFFQLAAGYEYHWDVFLAPPPRPHHEFIEGNNNPLVADFYETGLTAKWEFTVPRTALTFYGAPDHYADFGIAPGTPVYLEEKYEDPYFNFFAEATTLDGTPIDYSFTVTRISAVPEPGTWAMMIVGFAAAGAMLRSARRRTRAFA